MAAGIPLQEYVIKLGARVDMGSINKVMNALKSTKFQMLGMTTAIVGAGTAIYKFVKDQTALEQSFVATAKKQRKSVEEVRASENALKAMGKTMKEVARDPSLKKMYDDLVQVNRSMALPNMKGALANVSNLQGAFAGLKSTVSYLMQWINAKILANLETPIKRITEMFNKVGAWIRQNIGEISSKIGSFVSSFASGLIGIIDFGAKIVAFFDQLPDAVKKAVGSISLVLLALKAGPLGWIMMAIQFIGGLIDDYNNFKWNKAHPEEVPVDIAFPGIWKILDDETKSGGEKFVEIGEKVATGLIKGIKSMTTAIAEVLAEVFTLALDAMRESMNDFISDILSMLPEPIQKLLGIDVKKQAADLPAKGFNSATGEVKGFTPKERPFTEVYEHTVKVSGMETFEQAGQLHPKPPKMTGSYSEWADFQRSWQDATFTKNADKLRDLAALATEFQTSFNAAPNGFLGKVSAEEKAVLVDFQAKLEEINSKDYTVELKPEFDQSKLPAALQSVQGYLNSNPVQIAFTAMTGGGTKKNALGGRYSSRIVTEVAEDGDPEYIIPIKKEARAIPLVMSMLKEMGGAAVNRIAEGLGLGAGGLSAGAGAMGGMPAGGLTINNYNTVNASNTINVQATGADGREIGQTAYNATERYLVRTLKGVLGQ